MNRMPALKDRSKMASDFSNLPIPDIGIKNFCQDIKLPFPRKLFIVEVLRGLNNRVLGRFLNLFPNLQLNTVAGFTSIFGSRFVVRYSGFKRQNLPRMGCLHLKITFHRKGSRSIYLNFSNHWKVVT